MGFVLYSEAGTFEFKPADYGLVPGDQCIVFCVGGGGAGGSGTVYSSGSYEGGSGETSSFGNVLSALGGAGGKDFYSSDTTPNESIGNSLGGRASAGAGGGGAGGWFPGASITGGMGLPGDLADVMTIMLTQTAGGAGGAAYGINPPGGGGAPGCRGNINGVGADGGNTNDVSVASPGGGGAGFGAGGGGAVTTTGTNDNLRHRCNGGNSGEVHFTTYVISEKVQTVLVTVGAGGVASTDDSYVTTLGGAGCNGCVCIVW